MKSQKYLVCTSANMAGLNHLQQNLFTLLKFAYERNVTLVMPNNFRLHGQHNKNKKLQFEWSDYFNLKTLKIDGKFADFTLKIPPETPYSEIIFVEMQACRTVLYNGTYITPQEKYCEVEHTQEIIQTASQIIKGFPDNYVCIHIRKGDLAYILTANFPVLEKACRYARHLEIVSNGNVLRTLLNQTVYNRPYELVYIMSNEAIKKHYFEKKLSCQVLSYENFSELKSIQNNFILYCIETEIMHKAKLKIGTHKHLNNVKLDILLLNEFKWTVKNFCFAFIRGSYVLLFNKMNGFINKIKHRLTRKWKKEQSSG